MKIKTKLTAMIGKEAKKRLAEMQAELRYKGFGGNETTAGKIVAKLLLMEGSLENLEKEYMQEK